jgi:hypothetical protein
MHYLLALYGTAGFIQPTEERAENEGELPVLVSS